MPDTHGTIARELLQADIKKAEAVSSALRSQSLAVVGVSGGLLTLVAGFLALAGLKQGATIDSTSRNLIALALVSYVLAAILALLVYFPGWVVSIDGSKFGEYMTQNWTEPSSNWMEKAAKVEVEYLASIQGSNAKIVRFYISSLVMEVVGIAFTAAAALLILTHL